MSRNFILLLLVASTLAFVGYQNFSFPTYENLKSYDGTEQGPELVAPAHANISVYDTREELERTASSIEKKLKADAHWGASNDLKVQLLDRTGLMQVHYSGITQVWVNYYVDKQDMNLEVKQPLSKNVQLSLDHHPKEQKSSMVVNVSW